MEYYKNELSHHGILGQKWGHQNGPPYPLDESDHSAREEKAGWEKSLKKASKAYKKESEKAARQVLRNQAKHRIDAYNKAAEYMNNGGIAKYNSEHEVSDPDYASGYMQLFEDIMNRNMAVAQLHEIETNEHYKKAQAIVKEYGLEKYDSLVRENNDTINELRKRASGNKSQSDQKSKNDDYSYLDPQTLHDSPVRYAKRG